MEQVFLSRRDLLSLLKKLDSKKSGDAILAASVIKHDMQNKLFNQTAPLVTVTALEDEIYYGENHDKFC